MIGREQILEMIPHQGAMCLWDRVLEWDADAIRLEAGNHRNADHPLCANGRLHAVHLCEYGAQAMAVHGGLLARESGGVAPPGMLVALRGVELHVSGLDGLTGELECHAQVLAQSPTTQQYGFRITHAGQLLAEGRAAVMLNPGDN